jgi:hypothetical protein
MNYPHAPSNAPVLTVASSSNSRKECCGDSFCVQCYDYHVTYSRLKLKEADSKRQGAAFNLRLAPKNCPVMAHPGVIESKNAIKAAASTLLWIHGFLRHCAPGRWGDAWVDTWIDSAEIRAYHAVPLVVGMSFGRTFL